MTDSTSLGANLYDPIWKDYFVQRRAFRGGREVYFTDPAMPETPQSHERLVVVRHWVQNRPKIP